MPNHYPVLPIPARMSHTELHDAGPLQLGVEYRLLNEEIIAEEYGPDARAKFGDEVPPDLRSQVDEDGVSVHVFDRTSGQEWLRFDCFEDYPHYHYIHNEAGSQTVHDYDAAAHGPMLEWVVDCLARRLPEMLAQAGGEELARRVDPRALEQKLPEVERAIERARAAGRPIPVAETIAAG